MLLGWSVGCPGPVKGGVPAAGWSVVCPDPVRGGVPADRTRVRLDEQHLERNYHN